LLEVPEIGEPVGIQRFCEKQKVNKLDFNIEWRKQKQKNGKC
jgi:hypothetical protein